MKNSLSLKLSNELKLTPALQQAIKILQLSTAEIIELIQQESLENPFIDIDKLTAKTSANKEHFIKNENDIFNKDFENIYHTVENLQSYLNWQIELSSLSEQDITVASHIIDSVDDNGHLTASLDEIYHGLINVYPDLTENDVIAILHYIQTLDPIGCATRDFIESLEVQLRLSKDNIHIKQIAQQIVSSNPINLFKKNIQELAKIYKSSFQDIEDAINLVKSLKPHPGSAYSQIEPIYITPDINVFKQNNIWKVKLNKEIQPRLCIDKEYLAIYQSTKRRSHDEFLRDKISHAKILKRSIDTRNSNLLRVAEFIVEYQQNFFDKGAISLLPLTIAQIAESLDVHESTVSRLTNGKYMDTPHGLLELKYFLSSHVTNEDGTHLSSKSIQAQITNIIEHEDKEHPMSDIEICNALLAQGVKIARRTVSKYREAANIPTSHERKKTCTVL